MVFSISSVLLMLAFIVAIPAARARGRPVCGPIYACAGAVRAVRLLRDKAASGDFMPYTNGEQDVLETVFPVHGLMRVEPPAHRHLAQPSDIGSKCEALSY